jgi:hypothetical protein
VFLCYFGRRSPQHFYQAMTTEAVRQPIRSNPQILGTIGMIAAPMMLVEAVLTRTIGLPGGMFGRTEGVLGLFYLVGFVCSAFGLRMLRVTGKGLCATFLLVVQIAGFSLAACQNILQILGRANRNNKLFQIADMAWPFSHILMLVIGVATVLAGVWKGWRKFTPLFCGLALPLAVAAGGLLGGEALEVTFGVLTAASFLLLGYAIRTPN